MSDVKLATDLKDPCFELKLPNKVIYNGILECASIEVMISVLKRGKIVINGRGSSAREYRDMAQCQKCQSVSGHFQHACCALKPTCRHCGGPHILNLCNRTNEPAVCSNCIKYNKINGTTHPTNHRVTNERCFVKIIRYGGLKNHFATQK